MNCKGLVGGLLLIGIVYWADQPSPCSAGGKKVDGKTYELRIYYAMPGKMDDLHARFRNHTCKLLEKHGMSLVGFWTDNQEPNRKLIYLVAHPNRADADKNWKAFGADPDWQKAKIASEVNGRLVEKVDRVWLTGTDYSVLK
jgi:hypothetical protein